MKKRTSQKRERQKRRVALQESKDVPTETKEGLNAFPEGQGDCRVVGVGDVKYSGKERIKKGGIVNI